jgi:hypothetical protein
MREPGLNAHRSAEIPNLLAGRLFSAVVESQGAGQTHDPFGLADGRNSKFISLRQSELSPKGA